MKTQPDYIDKSIFGRTLKQIRNDDRVSLSKVARMVHLSKGSLCAYELGSALPSLDKTYAIAELYHVSIDYLVGRCEYSSKMISTKQQLAELILRLNNFVGIEMVSHGSKIHLEITDDSLNRFLLAQMHLSFLIEKQDHDPSNNEEDNYYRDALFNTLLMSLSNEEAINKKVIKNIDVLNDD